MKESRLLLGGSLQLEPKLELMETSRENSDIKLDQLLATINSLKAQVDQLSHKINGGSRKYQKLRIRCEDGRIHWISPENLLCCRASGSYCEFHLLNDVVHIASKPLSHFQTLLDPNQFLRTHRSWLVNLNRILSYDPFESVLLVDQKKIPLSRTHLALFKSKTL